MKMKRLTAVLAALAIFLCTGAVRAEEKQTFFDADWYQQALADSVLSRGNNERLQRVIERAKSGEEITLAVIGGSITEGVGPRLLFVVQFFWPRPAEKSRCAFRR